MPTGMRYFFVKKLLTTSFVCALIIPVMETNTNSSSTEIPTATVKRGRGRPHGSNSFENVQIKHLLNFLSEDASIPVSKIWMRDTLGCIIEARPLQVIKNDDAPSITTEQSEEKVQYALETFEAFEE
jgi:hypothetical protein